MAPLSAPCRGRPRAPPGACTSSGVPSISLVPNSITTTRSTRPITRSMSCSTRRIERPSSRSWRSTSARPSFSFRRRPAAGSSSSSSDRVGGERAGDLHQALLAEGEVAGLLVHQLAHADALQLPLGLLHQAALLGAVGAQHRRQHAVAAAQVRAEGDVLEHGHAGDHLHVLEGARDAAPRDLARGERVDALAEQRDLAARRRQHAGDEVEDGATCRRRSGRSGRGSRRRAPRS